MEAVVVDTNVAIVANRNADTHVDEACQLACVERLEALTKQGIVAIDDKDLILKEYSDHLAKSGSAKGTGDIFFIHVLKYLYNTDIIRRISVTPVQDEKTGFEELPKRWYMTPKYPKTPSWPWSPGKGRKSGIHPEPLRFVSTPIVVTEKLDGGNTLLHEGKVYARSVSTPSEAKWLAMVKKHHAWKVTEPGVCLYGEDIYGVHSIVYDPVTESKTFYAFAMRDSAGAFAAFSEVEEFARQRKIPVVPVLFRGKFNSIKELRTFVEDASRESSVLGGEREGVVIRLAQGFSASEFQDNVCKSVRAGHVRSDEHWSKHWQPCSITSDSRID